MKAISHFDKIFIHKEYVDRRDGNLEKGRYFWPQNLGGEVININRKILTDLLSGINPWQQGQEKNKNLKLKDKKIKELKEDLVRFKELLQNLRRRKFGPSSESNQVQQNMFNEIEELAEQDDNDNEKGDQNKSTVKGHTRTRGKRLPLPETLERVDKIIDLSEEEKKGKKKIGEEVSEKLVIIPSKVFVEKTIRPKYAPIDGKGGIITAPTPKTLLPKSIASSSLIAYIITSKYVDHLPLYRQETMFKRIKVELNRASMARWLIKVAEKVMPLYNLLQEKLLEQEYVQMDETRVQVLKENGKKATSKSFIWVRHTPGEKKIVLYDYAPNRSGAVPVELLTGFKGTLQVDGYDGYSRVCEENKLQRIGCFDHVRRKFVDASRTSAGKKIGKKGVRLIDKLYKIEKKIKEFASEDRLRIRQEEAVPILNELKDWVDELRSKISSQSTAGKAINYTYNEWKYLTPYTEDPKLNISNIDIENAIRPFAIGRRNWLFSDSVAGADASAMNYSLIETAKKNGFEPFDYLVKMLDKLPHAETVDDFEKLLPLKGLFKI